MTFSPGKMRSAIAVGLLTMGAVASPESSHVERESSPNGQQVFSFPLPNGFPNVTDKNDIAAIEQQARGTLANGPLPSNISDLSAVVWSLIAFNEIFEVAYFTSLIANVSNRVDNYEVGTNATRQIVLNALEAVRAQEELHALGANGVLQTAGRETVQACQYKFPVDNFDDAIAFAATFTDVVLGTLQEALTSFGVDGDVGFLGLVGSVIGQEGEQNGFYRTMGRPAEIPSAKPFLTASSGSFALSALMQLVVVPGSCPSMLPLPVFPPLTVNTTNIDNNTSTVDFSFNSNGSNTNPDDLRLVYITGQNAPVVTNLTSIQ
jgi:hypothetical protein